MGDCKYCGQEAGSLRHNRKNCDAICMDEFTLEENAAVLNVLHDLVNERLSNRA